MNTARDWAVYGMMWAFILYPLTAEIIRWSKVK